ncbi:MAG: acetylglutamate kinase [Gemmatimonadetes bacterium]|nr:acetylglutamate kinase [Gemmatimonadota bacterium]
MSVRVVKIGGAALTDAGWLSSFGTHLMRSGSGCVVVHGGGPDINALSERLGLSFTWSNGRRVTSPEMLDAAAMVLSGRLNKRIVAALIGAGGDAVGISGEDGGLIRTVFADGGKLGRVGEVMEVRSELLEWLLSRGLVPVVSPISRGPDGDGVNVNADEVAGAVAAALGAPELLFITDVAGVLDAGVVRPELTTAEARALIEADAASGGMALKLRAAMQALAMGVAAVRIGRFDALHDPAAGTRIRHDQEAMTCR